MLVFAVVATILPALALTVASSRQDRRSIVDQIAQELRGTSAEAAWEIDQWLSDRLRDLRVAATAYAVARSEERRVGKEGRFRGAPWLQIENTIEQDARSGKATGM